jgi:transposase
MDTEQFRLDVAAGTIDVDRLVGLIASQQKLIAGHEAEIEGLRKQLEELKQQIEKNPTQRLDEAYSEKAEEDRQAKAQGKPKPRKKPKRQGRITTAEKIARAARMETVYPPDCAAADCRFSHTRVAWRLEDGRAILVAYAIHRCGNHFGQPPGLPGRGEFGMEILIAVAYQVYTLGLSLDKACQVLGFFQGLTLTKSQANALLNQLARQWEAEFDTLCLLLANAAVVHSDETSWSINSVWAFLTDTLTLMFYGSPRNRVRG